jgi:signal peptidase II
MNRYIYAGFLAFIAIIIIDQNIKFYFIDGYAQMGEAFAMRSDYIDLILTYNRGVAFSMFAFLEGYLKYLQIMLLLGIGLYVYITKPYEYALPIGMFLGAGVSNIADRFMHEGVVDYVFWHYGFNFAVFNFADVVIDIAVVWILILAFLENKRNKESAKDKAK